MPTALPPTTCSTHFEAGQLRFERPHFLAPMPTRTEMPLDSKTVVRCRISQHARLDRCAIQSETPVGLGFGDWAKQVAESWRVKDREVAGCPTAGGTVDIVIITKGQ